MVFGRNRALEIVGLQLEAMLHRGLDRHRRAAGDRDHVGIAHPIGRRDDHLVAGIDRREKRVEQDMLAAGADDRLRGFVVEPVLALELGRDRLAQRLDAGDGRIFRLAALDGGDGGALDIVRRVEIRLADRQRDDVAPGGFQFARFLRHRDGRGGLDPQQGVGNEGHDDRIL